MLTAPDGAPGDLFGFSVAAGNQFALVGAQLHDGSSVDSGIVHVFERLAGTWTLSAQLVPREPEHGGFGHSTALSAHTAVIGAVGEGGVGTAYLMQRSHKVWVNTATLVPADGDVDNLFAWSVAIDGGVAVVGAPNDSDRAFRAGSVCVFERDGDANWSQVAELLPSDGQAGDEFGAAVAVQAGTILVGNWADNDAGFTSGSAYVFERQPNGVWREMAKLRASDAGGLYRFGIAVSLSGSSALIGALGATGREPYTGAAYVFVRGTNGQWQEMTKLYADDGANSDAFGWSVALDGATAVIGAKQDEREGFFLAGSAYVFAREQPGRYTRWPRPDGARPLHRGQDVRPAPVFGRTFPQTAGQACLCAVGGDARLRSRL